MGEWFGLYYPHVHFRDEDWLKLTALYWDRLDRFDTDGPQTTLPSHITRAEIELADAGFVLHTFPGWKDAQWTARRFIEALNGIDLSRYAVPPPEQFELGGFFESLASWKMPAELINQLEGMDLAARSSTGPDRIQMHATLAHAYLLLLGSRVAPRRGAAPLADDEFDLSATRLGARRLISGVLDQPAPQAGAGERAALLVNLSVTAVLPRCIGEIPVQRIIEFRDRYAGERARFRDAMEAMVVEATQLEDIRDPEVLLDHMQNRFDTRIQPALKDLQRAMRGDGMGWALGAINVQAAAPPVMTSALAVLATRPSAAQAAAIGLGGFALGVRASALQRRAQREHTLMESPIAYLHQLQTGLTPLGLAQRVQTAARRFTPPLNRLPMR